MSPRLLFCALACGLVLSACATPPPAPPMLASTSKATPPQPAGSAKVPRHWSYTGNENPLFWGELSEDYLHCKHGRNQSPVDLHEATGTSKGKLAFRHPPAFYTVTNNGHTIEAVPDTTVDNLRIGQTPFSLKQFHFHVPSEHTFRTKHFPMEIHFVHQSRTEELTVLAVMVKEGRKNPTLQPLLERTLTTGESFRLSEVLDITPLFPEKRAHFRLNGSLTTPPCSEGVHWMIFTSPIEASDAQIARMRELIGVANNRPVQPLNARIVIEGEHD